MAARNIVTIAIALTITAAWLSADRARPGIDWPSFRGPAASGVAEGAPAPTTWHPIRA